MHPPPTRRLQVALLLVSPVLMGQAVEEGPRHDPTDDEAARFGTAIAAVGDIDGDGTPDFVVSAPGWADARGAVIAVSGAKRRRIWTIQGEHAEGALGEALAAVGDQDGDGHIDLAIGSPDRAMGDRSCVGTVAIISGKTGVALTRIEGSAAAEFLGRSMSSLRDRDGDGKDDLLLAQSVADENGQPRIGGVAIRSTGTRMVLAAVDLDAAGDGVHFDEVCIGPDIDGDGTLDLLAGAPNHGGDTPPGLAAVFSGKDGKLLRRHAGPVPGGALGTAFALVGDWDGDGGADYAIGAPGLGMGPLRPKGAVHVYSGRKGEVLASLSGEIAGASFGAALLAVPGKAGSSRPELWVSAPRDSSGNSEPEGRVLVFVPGAAAPRAQIRAAAGENRFGEGLGAIGDLDGDGVTEVAIGVPGASIGERVPGRVHLHSGRTGERLHSIELESLLPGK